MARKRVVLVTGATGNQGGAVARELLKGDFTVRALTRNPRSEKAQALVKLGAEVIEGDFDDAASLEHAMNRAWGVFSVQNSWEGGVEKEEEDGKRVAKAAKEMGVQHFVYTSVASANRKTGIPHFDSKWRIEEEIRRLALPSYTIIRPVFFMENFLSPWFKPGIDEGKLRMGMSPDTSLQMIALKHIGKYGLLAFEKHEELTCRDIDIAGDEKTMPETARIIGKAARKAITFECTPIEEVRKWSEDFAIMLEWFDRVGYSADIQLNEKEYGIRPTRLEEWASQQSWG